MVNVITNYGHLLIEALGQTLVLALCGCFRLYNRVDIWNNER